MFWEGGGGFIHTLRLGQVATCDGTGIAVHAAAKARFLHLFLRGNGHLECAELDLRAGFASAGLGDLLLLKGILLGRVAADVQASKVRGQGIHRSLDIVLDMAGRKVTEDGVRQRIGAVLVVDDSAVRVVGVVVVDVHLGTLPGARRGRHDFKRPDTARQGPASLSQVSSGVLGHRHKPLKPPLNQLAVRGRGRGKCNLTGKENW